MKARDRQANHGAGRWISIAAVSLAIGAGCDKGGAPPAPATSECAAVRALGKRSADRWKDLNQKGPAADAPLVAGAEHAEGLAKAAREMGAEFGKLTPQRKDLAESVEGVRMLGDLAAQKLDALGKTVRELDAKIAPMEKIEGTANDAVDKLGKDIAADVGCGKGGPPECAAVTARVSELDGPRVPSGLAQAAQFAQVRADALEGLAKAIEALPAAPPKQKAREDAARNARAGAAAFHELSKVLASAAPPQERLDRERQEAGEAATRFMAELRAASEVCQAAPAGSASAAPAGSAK
jgi:hypothetical protein